MLPENLVAVSGSLVMMAGVDLPRTCLLTGTLNPLSSYSYTSGSGPAYEGGGGDNYVTLYMGGDNCIWGVIIM